MSQYSLKVVNEVLEENGIPWRAVMPVEGTILCAMTHGHIKALFVICNADFEHNEGSESCYVYLTGPMVKEWKSNISFPMDWMAFADVMCEFHTYGVISGVELQDSAAPND